MATKLRARDLYREGPYFVCINKYIIDGWPEINKASETMQFLLSISVTAAIAEQFPCRRVAKCIHHLFIKT
jgi:hypothetical protein